MQTFRPETLIDFTAAIFEAVGAPSDIAKLVAESLVTANLLGHDSHGIIRVKTYIEKIRQDYLDPAARPTVEHQMGAVTTVNGHWGFGQITARYGAEVARDLAHESGIGCVALQQVNHIGRLGEYAEQIARDSFASIVLTSGSMHGPRVAPHGGQEHVFATNPMAWAVPRAGDRPPLVLDFATAGVSVGKVMVALSKGEQIPPGLLLDRDGKPSTDPADLKNGGMLIPFGTYKGYGLNLMIEILANTLCNFAPVSSPEFQQGNPTLILALSIEAFTTRERFDQHVDTLLERIKRVKPLEGFDGVLLPGEVESLARAERVRDGIPVPDATWHDLRSLAEELEIASP